MNPALLIQRCNSIAFFHREGCYANYGKSQKKRHSIKHNLSPAQTAIFVAVSSTYYAIYPLGNVSHWQSLDCKSSPHLIRMIFPGYRNWSMTWQKMVYSNSLMMGYVYLRKLYNRKLY